MSNRLYISNIILLIVLVQIINQLAMSNMDFIIFKYLLTTDQNNLLYKYRDYFPICRYIPKHFDKIIFIFVYILYIPIIILITIINYIYKQNKTNLVDLINFNIKYPLMLSKGMVYNAILPYFYCLRLNTNLSSNTFNKLSWNTLFTDNNIPTPKIVTEIIEGTIKNQAEIDKYIKNNSKLIVKPVSGSCGNDVFIYNKNNIPSRGIYIIQELIESNNKSFRIITNCYKNTITLWDIYLLTSNSIVTNISQGGLIHKYDKKNKKFIGNNKTIKLLDYEQKYLEYSIKSAKKCHQLLPFCPTIGWDVIFGKNGPYFLEGNIGVTICCDNDVSIIDRQLEYLNFITPIYNHIMN
jgi:hypothetical protein